METNMYEVAARHRKAARLAILLAREYSDVLYGGLPIGLEADVAVVKVAEAYGINPPSGATLAEIRELLAP